jgi:hypothetical protein
MSDAERLLRVGAEAPFLSLEGSTTAAAKHALAWSKILTLRVVRGRKARTVQAMFDEFAAALQFPYYFGESWAAFDECIADLEWLPTPAGIAVLIYDAAQVLLDEDPEELAVMVRAFTGAAETFGQPIAAGEWWDRPALPFHVVLHDEGRNPLGRWEAAGVHLAPFAP